MYDDLKRWVRTVPDFPKEGILFRDITPILLEPEALGTVCDIFYERYMQREVDKIAAIESRGFIFASILSYRLGKGLIPLRKRGKLPWKRITETYALEYGEAAIEMHTDAVSPGERVVIIDDLLATGGTARAAVNLIMRQEGIVEECAFVIELSDLEGRNTIEEIPVFCLMSF
ncbi:MAG: adenine phosphoribosyltransferase [bacterium]|nr:MAG: adenine phosphoribosyltransferase [bacterium]